MTEKDKSEQPEEIAEDPFIVNEGNGDAVPVDVTGTAEAGQVRSTVDTTKMPSIDDDGEGVDSEREEDEDDDEAE